MRIIKKKENVMRVTCNACGTVLEIDESDIKVGYAGIAYVTCPVCSEEIYDDKIDNYSQNVTIDNLEYPRHFYDFSDGTDLDNDTIIKEIKYIIERLRNDPSSFCCFVQTGNTFIVGFNFSGDEEYTIIVTKNYKETCIHYTEEDFKKQEEVNYEGENRLADGCKRGIIK